MTAVTPGMDPAPRRRLRRSWLRLRGFSNTNVKAWTVILVALIGAVLIWAVASHVSDIDRRVRDGDRERAEQVRAADQREEQRDRDRAEEQREADQRAALNAAYAADLRAYDIAVRDRIDCVADVDRSNLNRGQHLANVVAQEQQIAAYESLLALTPPSYQYGIQIIIDRLNDGINALRAGPLLSTEPRTVDECPPTPTVPVAPTAPGG